MDLIDSGLSSSPSLLNHFCTYFDKNYLNRGLALYYSLNDNCKQSFILWALCFDDESHEILSKLGLERMRLIRRNDFESNDSELAAARLNRSFVEYYWTCTPSLPLYIFNLDPTIELVTYLDADLFFFSDPQPIFDELGDQSILIHGHRYSKEHEYNVESAGIYNVGLISFRRDDAGLECLCWWRERCNEWCYARHEDGKFGDQKYLDDWPERFVRLIVLQNPGAGLAPWNFSRYRLDFRNGEKRVDDYPLIFFHFHALKLASPWLVIPSYEGYRISSSVMTEIYAPYLQALRRAGKASGLSFADNLVSRDWQSNLVKLFYQEAWFNGFLTIGSTLWYIGGKSKEFRSYIQSLGARVERVNASMRRAKESIQRRNSESHAVLLVAIKNIQERNNREGMTLILRAVAESPTVIFSHTFLSATFRYYLGNSRLEALKETLGRFRARF